MTGFLSLLLLLIATTGATASCWSGKKPFGGSCTHYTECINDNVIIKRCLPLFRFDKESRECKFFLDVACDKGVTNLLEKSCEDGEVKPVSGDCGSYQECQGGIFVTKRCFFDEKFDTSSRTCRPGELVSCDEANEGCKELDKRAISGKCQEYEECLDGTYKKMTCPQGQAFNVRIKTCDEGSLVNCGTGRTCEDFDRKKVEGNCNEYQECLRGEYIVLTCPSGEAYNDKSKTCQEASSVDCTGNKICTDLEKRPVPAGCAEFEMCIEGKFLRVPCPLGEGFDPERLKCSKSVRCFTNPPSCEEGVKRPVHGRCDEYEQCLGGEFMKMYCDYGKSFDKVTLECKDQAKVDCIPAGSQCIEGQRKPIEGNCRAYLDCIGGRIQKSFCSEGEGFDEETSRCKQGYCKTQASCNENEKRAVAGSCREYEQCQGGKWVLHACLLTYNFDPKYLYCGAPSIVKCDQGNQMGCKEHERRPVEGEAQSYEKCINGKFVKMSCAEGEYFETTSLVCVKKPGVCREYERRPIESSCQEFEECVGGTMVRQKCLFGNSFDSKTLTCRLPGEAACQGVNPQLIRLFSFWPFGSKTTTKPRTPATKQTTMAAKPTTLGPKPATGVTEPTTLAPKLTTLAPKPTTLAPKPGTRVTEPSTLAPRPSTLPSKPTPEPTAHTTRGPNSCTKEGSLISVPGSCKDYKICAGGEYLPSRCPWCKNFDPHLGACVWAWRYKC